jgi:hypothetical protein
MIYAGKISGSSNLAGVGALATDPYLIPWPPSMQVTGSTLEAPDGSDHGSDLGTPANFDDPD